MGILSWILLGLIAGALAKFIMPGRDPGGIIVTILIGIAGAFVGGFLGTFMGLGSVESFDLGGILIATVGAIVLLILYRLIMKAKAGRSDPPPR
ncbi:MAG TPA: GlsB/YeaQ/YmgE family stress response membrane protein [Verrucomicrobiales bacterium]|nr:GlsB/YeaQ/YmgE family stress response membrane protein [Verrucomicrobiales bacterium]